MYLKGYYDQNNLSHLKQKRIPYSLSDVAVPVQVNEMKFGPRKAKTLNLEKWCFPSPPLLICVPVSPQFERDWSCGNLFKLIGFGL